MPIKPWAVGLFIFAGLGLFTALLFLIGSRQEAFSKNVKFETQFSDLSGVGPGSKVQVSGIDAGKISKIEIPKSSSEKFRLELEIQEKLHPMVHTDSIVSIETQGVVGDKFVLIHRGSDRTERAAAGAMLPSKEPLDISAIMDKASALVKDVSATVGDVRGRVDVTLDSITGAVNHADGLITDIRPNIRQIAGQGSRIAGTIDTLVADINAGNGSVGLLLRDEATKRQLQDTLANVQQASANLSATSAQANQIVSDFESRQLLQKAQATLENLQAVSQQLSTTMKDALAEDSMGEDGASNLRQTLTNINRSTANLAEDTEALKHNFFLRGFFKKRGFFSLDQISPTEYEQACARHKSCGTRLWLQAQDLTRAGTDGKEELTSVGRLQIDQAVASFLNTLGGHLIVVEGYAPAGAPGQQFAVGRRRAVLVRAYLETHYHLRHSDIGVVSLGGTPPADAGRTTWDGAAITILDDKAAR